MFASRAEIHAFAIASAPTMARQSVDVSSSPVGNSGIVGPYCYASSRGPACAVFSNLASGILNKNQVGAAQLGPLSVNAAENRLNTIARETPSSLSVRAGLRAARAEGRVCRLSRPSAPDQSQFHDDVMRQCSNGVTRTSQENVR